MTIDEQVFIKDLITLNKITQTLNQAVDMQSALTSSLIQLTELIGLETGWIFLKDASSQNRWAGKGYRLVVHHNLPPSLALDEAKAWSGSCDCQSLCNKNQLDAAYNEVRCSRLAESRGNRRGLIVHASVPLCSGDKMFGIMNIASPRWDVFTPEALMLLTNVGCQMGIALERAQLFDLLKEQHIHEQAALLDFSNQLLGCHNLTDLMIHLTEEVCNLLHVDACALALPSDNPHLLTYKAASGWRANPVTHQRHIPADISSNAGLVMENQRPLLVEDCFAHDPTPWNADWLEEEEFRGHAVVPLIAEGESIGVLIINTREPRALDEHEQRILRLMANQAALALEQARLHQEEIQRQRMEEELSVGRQIQLSLLPESCPTLPGWQFAALYRPARIVGGDFYDFFELPGHIKRLGIVIADVSGKGVPAAMFMSLSRSIIRTKAMNGTSPATALSRANRLIAKDNRSKLFLTAFYGLLDVATGQLTYARAGHNYPLWLHQTSTGQTELTRLTGQGIVMGIFESIKLQEVKIEMGPGDLLVFYTDGVTEAMNEQEEILGEARLEELILAHPQASPEELLAIIVMEIEQFMADCPQADDFTLVVVKREEK